MQRPFYAFTGIFIIPSGEKNRLTRIYKKFNHEPWFLKYSIIIWQNVGVGSKIGVKCKIIIDQR